MEDKMDKKCANCMDWKRLEDTKIGKCSSTKWTELAFPGLFANYCPISGVLFYVQGGLPLHKHIEFVTSERFGCTNYRPEIQAILENEKKA